MRRSEITLDTLYDREEQLLEELNSGEAKDWIYYEIVDVYKTCTITYPVVQQRKKRNMGLSM